MDTAMKLKKSWLSRDSFRNFCIMKRVLHSGIQGIEILRVLCADGTCPAPTGAERRRVST